MALRCERGRCGDMTAGAAGSRCGFAASAIPGTFSAPERARGATPLKHASRRRSPPAQPPGCAPTRGPPAKVACAPRCRRRSSRKQLGHSCLLARPTDIVRPTQLAADVIRRIASPNLPNDEPLEPCRFRQKVSVDDCLRLEFDLRRDSCLQKFRATHGPQCGPLASRRLSCLFREMR